MKQAFLVLVQAETPKSPELGRRYMIPKEGLHIGNVPEAEVLVFLGEKTSHHIFVFMEGTTCYVHDLTYTGEVLVDGVPSQKSQIFDGELLQIKELAFEYCSENSVKRGFFEYNEEARREDVLTRALNRETLFYFIDQDIHRYAQWESDRRAQPSRGPYPPMSVIMLDIDHFGAFNKKYDHFVGDEVLKELIKRLKDRVRASDMIGRFGGEEFIVYLPYTEHQKAVELAEELRKLVADTPFPIGLHREVRVTASMGVARFEADMKNAKEFVRAANERMLKAKEEGRNRVLG